MASSSLAPTPNLIRSSSTDHHSAPPRRRAALRRRIISAYQACSTRRRCETSCAADKTSSWRRGQPPDFPCERPPTGSCVISGASSTPWYRRRIIEPASRTAGSTTSCAGYAAARRSRPPTATSCRNASRTFAVGAARKLQTQQRRKIRNRVDDVVWLHREFVCGPTI